MGMINKTKSCLGSKFEMKEIGEESYIMGIKITRDRNSILSCPDQYKYMEKVLKRFNMENLKALSTPVYKGQVFNKAMYLKNKQEEENMN